jgi:hypothetical protein
LAYAIDNAFIYFSDSLICIMILFSAGNPNNFYQLDINFILVKPILISDRCVQLFL